MTRNRHCGGFLLHQTKVQAFKQPHCTIVIETPCGNGNYRVTCVRNIQNKLRFTYLKKTFKALPLSLSPAGFPNSFF